MEIVIVAFAVLVALAYLGRRTYRKYFRKSDGGCGGCGTCPSARASRE